MFFALFLSALVNCAQRRRKNVKYDAQKDGRWFYQQLTKYQKPFYEALEYWRENNLLTGAPMMYLDSDNNLDNKVLEITIKQYLLGYSSALNTHFLSAVAAWRADHPEIFYIDVSKLLFRISQDEDNHYHILFGCVSYPNLLFDFVKPDQIDSMIINFNSRVKEIVDSAKVKETIEDKVKAVHNYLKENVVYNRPYQTSTEEEANWIYYSYGSLINGKSVCDGFSKAFQVIMNELNVPSVQVPGDALNSTEDSQSHSWNVVQIGDTWLLVDCTYDTTSGTNDWLLVDQQKTAHTHFPNGNLDGCGVTFYFPPALFPDYDKFTTKCLYSEKDPSKVDTILASYDGMNNSALLAKNLSLCYRYAYFSNDGTIQYYQWIDLYKFGLKAGLDVSTLDYDANFSQIPIGEASFYQIGIADSNSKRLDFGYITGCVVDDTDVYLQSARYYLNITFENKTMNENLLNPQIRYYTPAPLRFWPGYEYDFVFAMSEKLTSEDDLDVNFTKFKINVTAVSLHPFDVSNKREKIVGEEAANKTIIRNLRLINYETIGFTIKTSDSYAHDYMQYTLSFEGVKGSLSFKKPVSFTFVVKYFPNNGGHNTCTKMFGTGTLYVGARPVLITDGDIRNGGLNDNFEAVDPNGTVVPGRGATTSDLALVATRAEGDDETYEEYTATFDISLTLFCMSYLIRPGSYNCPLTIQLPFPDGFDPTKNEGVSFEVIHYNKDGTVNEKNTVVVGSAGLLITVSSFSPFRIQPKKESSLALEDAMYPLYASSFGGSPIITINDKNITNIVHDYTKDQTIKVVPPEGTQVEHIFLNSEKLSVDDLNSFSLPIDLLNQRSNTLEVHLVSDLALKAEEKIKAVYVPITANITAKTQSDEAKAIAAREVLVDPPANNLNEDNAIYAPDNYQNNYDTENDDDGKKKLSTGAIVGIVVGVVAAIAIVVLLVYFLVIRPKRVRSTSDGQ